MNRLAEFLLEHWLALAAFLAALGLFVAAAVRYLRSGDWAWRYHQPAAILASYAVGAFLVNAVDDFPGWLGPTICLAAFGVFVGLLVLVILTGHWSAAAGYALTCAFFFGLGAWTAPSLSDALQFAGVFLLSVRVQYLWWFLLLGLIPVLIYTSWHNLQGLGGTRRWIVLALRCALIVLLTLALAEVYARKANESVTVIFVWDRSYSIPPESAADTGKDLREKRIFDFINDSVAKRGPAHVNDRVGVIVFGKQPKLELPPSMVGTKLGFSKIMSQVDPSYTDIAAAMKLALASFPEGSGKRMVLISDGNENMGRAFEQAQIAKQNGVQVDVVPIDAGRKHQNEILIERLEAPAITEKDARLPLRVVIRSFHPQIVVARLNLRKITFDPAANDKGAKDDKERNRLSPEVKLRQGLNVFYFQQAGAKDDTVLAYEATVIPLRVETPEGRELMKGLPGDRIDNNEARVVVMSRGERAILLLRPQKRKGDEGDEETHQTLIDQLRAATKGLKVVPMTPEALRILTRGDNERLATFLSKFDAVVLANVPADDISPEEQAVIRSHVHDQGAGLIMIGGNKSFGAGGWQNTEIEKALPVNMELKSMKIEGKSGLVMIMHASEMQDGNAWQRTIAKLALEKLALTDMVGQIHYDHGFAGAVPGHRWHIPFQEVGGGKDGNRAVEHRKSLVKLVESMQPGDMPDVDPAFLLAHKDLTNIQYGLGTKHIILISDGDHWDASPAVVNRLKAAGITCTTVCITSHGQDEVKKMAALARFLKGRDYHVKDPSVLPAIYIKESRLVSQAFVHEKKFNPLLSGMREGPTEGMKGALPPLWGFVRTTPKESSLVKVLIETEKIGQYKFPILAAWPYGLGKSIAFTSDARTVKGGKGFWDRDWESEEMYTKFWSQTVSWILRPTETGKHLFMTTEHKDGKIRIIVEALDADKVPITDIELKAGITSPAFKVKDDKKFELKFEQKNAGIYEAEIPADEVGAYFINIQAKWKKDGQEVVDNVRAGVTIPYSPEFAEMDSNPTLLRRISAETGGQAYTDSDAALQEAAVKASVFRPVPESLMSLQPLWPWLVALTALCLLFDVAIRRIAIQPEAVWAKSVALWEKLRGRTGPEEKVAEFIERLRSRKASVGETMDKQKAAKKFETVEGAKPVEGPTVAPAAPTQKPMPKSEPAKTEKKKDEDFASRLMRAKKKAMEDRDKDKK
jgi:uncharacterized membrane protein